MDTTREAKLQGLLPQVLRREPQALEGFTKLLSPLFEKEAKRILSRERSPQRYGASFEPSDLVQDAFLSLFSEDLRPLKNWQEGGRTLLLYLRTFARLRMAALLRNRRRRATLVQCFQGGDAVCELAEIPREERLTPEEQLLANRLLQVARSRLTQSDFRLLLPLLLEDVPPANLAKELSVPLSVLYQRKRRLLSRLRCLGESLVA